CSPWRSSLFCSGSMYQGSYPKPSISVSPSGVIPVGGTVTIRCWHQLLDMRILLYKDEDENYLNYTDPVGSEAEFPITSARWDHGGSYTCRYSNRTGEVAYSEPSDPVQIIVAGEGPIPAPRLPFVHLGNCFVGEAEAPEPDLPDGGLGGALLPEQCQLLIFTSELLSDYPLAPTAGPLGRPDFTHANIARLGLGAVVLLILGLILVSDLPSVPLAIPRGWAQGDTDPSTPPSLCTPRSLDLVLQTIKSPWGKSCCP
uniref:Ig-like domain-containing protein n=1 Tax=Gopherus agassizii TaxID=38772 RepID=A0A452H990_9SAUR